MSSQLPSGWIEVQAGTIARIVGGGTPPSKDPANFTSPGSGIPWITPADLSGYREQSIAHGTRDLTHEGLAKCGATLLPKGTVLFSSRAPIGYIAIAANEISTNQGFKSFILPDGFDPRFTYYQLKYLKPEAEAIATGTTFKELSGAATATLPLKISPLTEQTRIADQLDVLLARVQTCNGHFDAIPALLKRFRQSVLNAAVSGDLLIKSPWNDENKDLVSAFPMVQIVDVIAEPLRNGKSVRDGDGLPVLRLTALKTDAVDIAESKSGDWSEIADASRFLIHDGDYLVSRGNGSKDFVGRGALVSNCKSDVAFPDTMIRFRPNTARLLPNYLKHVWASESVRSQINLAAKTTTGIWKVSQTDLEAIFLPLPSIKQQTEIVRRVEALFALADRIEARYAAARAHAQRLTPLLLAKAFRGELVPQDPNDEPASVLLQRIAAQRTQADLLPKPRKPRVARAARAPKETAGMTKSRQDADVKDQPYLADHLRRLGGANTAEALFKVAELPVADFYKQLAWEVDKGHIKDHKTALEAGHAP